MIHNLYLQFTKKLQYLFKNKDFLYEALHHRSFVNERDIAMRDNERLEFLGDAVLSLVISHALMKRYPDLKEGDLTVIRSSLVNERQLASIARSLNLGDYIFLGKGEEQTNGKEKDSILSDALEAVFAAVYLDGGYDVVFKVMESLFSEKIDSVISESEEHYYKSQLQELVQAAHYSIPFYTVISESGPDHEKTFIVELKVGKFITQGTGKSKKKAEQNAAKIVLGEIEKKGLES